MNQLLDLYRTLYNTEPATAEPITGSGSQRRYYRLKGQPTVIGTAGTSIEENRAFIALTRHFASKGLPVPHILAVSDDQMEYLQTDLGDTSLYQAVSKGRRSGIYSPEEKALLHKAMAMLPHFQITGVEDLDTTLCYPTPKMDAQSIKFDLNYFKYCYLKLLPDLDFNEITLQHDLDCLCADILSLIENGGHTLILRDFQARNVMVRPDGSLALIDYQGCRLGPAEYDLASFLWQASARYPAELRNQLTDTYIGEASRLKRAAEAHGVLPPDASARRIRISRPPPTQNLFPQLHTRSPQQSPRHTCRWRGRTISLPSGCAEANNGGFSHPREELSPLKGKGM